MTAKLPFTQAGLRRAITAARDDGRKITAIRSDGEVVSIEGPFHRPPRTFDRERSAAYCRCSDEQFAALIKDGLLPRKIPGTSHWDRKALDAALKTMDVRPRSLLNPQVYFIEMGRFIKIGFSGSARERLKDLQVATPYELKLLAKIDGDEECEQRLHAMFAHLRHRGEWFRKSKGLLAYIEWLRARKP